MDRTIRTEIVIDAPPERVWAALTGFGSYGAWNPCIRRVDGNAGVNQILHITIRFGWLPSIRFMARIDRFRRNEILGWRAAFLFGLLEGRHWFEMHPLDAGSTRFVHAETFSGILTSPFLVLFEGVIRASYEAMNRSLKTIVE
ncbi:SRPBCC domain-containing protein [Chlorobaculum sp. MV4-Y]|uniref:SRPBCC domain-containing protein n=1 Tax=Chlorobaculum sp. MV4-Y TaxID=2976335 RepID=UPI0021AF99BD|nr:SRPBCC domain-containing protein [Chlorobaculum sp. MV4-Y]UWX58344.1 SRPBCC domain-containing protein [Chlorobaculum sp. MV4-Y]